LRLLLLAFGLLVSLVPVVYAADSARAAKSGTLNLKSAAALVVEQDGQQVLFAKNVETVLPIASITKLMTALVVLDAKLPLDEHIFISKEDAIGAKRTRSRLQAGNEIARGDLLRLALMASENRAAAALARSYPGGKQVFVAAMNHKAVELGMWRTRYVDSTGLSSENVSTAQDLARLVAAAYSQPLIREYTTGYTYTVEIGKGRSLSFSNSNRLVKNSEWEIGLSKTGYISEAGRCLVMQAKIATTPVIIVLLDSWGKLTRIGDANRIKRWIESNSSRRPAG